MYRCIDAGWDPSPGPRVSPPCPWAQSQPHVHAPRFLRKKRSKGPKKKQRPKKKKGKKNISTHFSRISTRRQTPTLAAHRGFGGAPKGRVLHFQRLARFFPGAAGTPVLLPVESSGKDEAVAGATPLAVPCSSVFAAPHLFL